MFLITDSLRQALEADGLVLVPKEPTEKMLIAGERAIAIFSVDRAREAYCAMILVGAAAPMPRPDTDSN